MIGMGSEGLPMIADQVDVLASAARSSAKADAELLEIAEMSLVAILSPFTVDSTDEDLGCGTGCTCDQHLALRALKAIREGR